MKLGNRTKILLVGTCFAISIIGFMIKLPRGFRHYDKELHAFFYFMAAAFLNLLFAQNKMGRHVLIFVFLYLFGVAIEYAQEYSNQFFHKRIHGRYDIEDIQSNLKGLILFSITWIMLIALRFAYSKLNINQVENSAD